MLPTRITLVIQIQSGVQSPFDISKTAKVLLRFVLFLCQDLFRVLKIDTNVKWSVSADHNVAPLIVLSSSSEGKHFHNPPVCC